MRKSHFETLIREAIEELPPKIKEAMENVVFIVEREARRKKASEIGIRVDETLLGLYEGVPKTGRGINYSGVLPDKITIFQKPMEELAGGNEKKLKELVYEVVWHEIGHHLGFDEPELWALEAKKKIGKKI